MSKKSKLKTPKCPNCNKTKDINESYHDCPSC